MMVRSAPVSVSNTLWNPSMRRAVTIFPVTSVPSGRSKLFAQTRPYCRGRLHDDRFFRILQNLPEIIDIGVLLESSGRTYVDTLTAVYAFRLVDRPVEGRADHRIETSVDHVDGADSLAGCGRC